MFRLDNEKTQEIMMEVRMPHVVGGLIAFGIGLFLAFFYSPYVVEVIKGAIQPAFILLGLVAVTAAFLGNTSFRNINAGIGTVFLLLGLYGLYDECYAVLDLFSGMMPMVLIVVGAVCITYGIKNLK